MEHECAIGLWCECDYVNCISLSELKEQQRDFVRKKLLT